MLPARFARPATPLDRNRRAVLKMVGPAAGHAPCEYSARRRAADCRRRVAVAANEGELRSALSQLSGCLSFVSSS